MLGSKIRLFLIAQVAHPFFIFFLVYMLVTVSKSVPALQEAQTVLARWAYSSKTPQALSQAVCHLVQFIIVMQFLRLLLPYLDEPTAVKHHMLVPQCVWCCSGFCCDTIGKSLYFDRAASWLKHFFFFFLAIYDCIVPIRFLSWEIWVALTRESQLRQNRATLHAVHAGCWNVSTIHQTLTWTTGSLTCT